MIRLYTAAPELDPFSEEAIRAANPALDAFMNKREVLAMANDARLPSRENEYRNLVLNQRVEASTPFVAFAAWTACGDEPRDLTGLSVFAGLDLSKTADLTALILGHLDPNDGVWHVRPIFWLPEERLAEKAARDRAPYDLWAEQGYLETTPGASIDYEFIAHRLKDVFEDYNVTKIAFDRWNYPHLRPWLTKAGFSEQLLERTFVEFGQGFKSMSPALRSREPGARAEASAWQSSGSHDVQANATVERDAAGNRKLSKKRSSGRIDGAVALAMAIAAAPAAWTAKVDIAALIG